MVVAAYDAELDRQVAIKVVARRDSGPTAYARLLREAQAMAKVTHPNVCPIYEVGKHGDNIFVAMELVAGETLSVWQRGDRAWRDTLAMHVAAGRGLAAAHAVGIIHRDFKPDNVIVGKDGRPRVLDFGLARAIGRDDLPVDMSGGGTMLSAELTAAGAVMGTPSYMSPEHFRGQDIGPASDQFSVAVAVYRALFGSAPFAGSTIGEIRGEVLAGDAITPREVGEVPDSVVAAIMRGLSLHAADRFATIDAFLDELERPLKLDPDHDPSRGRRARRIGAAVLSLGALASVISASMMSQLDASARWILVQSSIAMVLLSTLGLVFRKRLITSAHNRHVGLVMLVCTGGFVVHRAVGVVLGTPPLDTLVGDAVMVGVVTVIAGLQLERWMIYGGPIAVIYLAVVIAAPSLAGPAFSALILIYAALAAWRWGR